MLGLVWFLVTYVLRLVISVFVEPSVNPIKHFPAVTVTAKLILPLCVPAFETYPGMFSGGPLAATLAPSLGLGTANTLAGLVLLFLPGLGGFLVWELKENWKQYRSNRSPVLKPAMIGHHGETMLRFMRPGFHSGTLPKLYAKLRKAERRANGRALHKHQEALHHVKESIRHFLEREFVMLLEGSKGWALPACTSAYCWPAAIGCVPRCAARTWANRDCGCPSRSIPAGWWPGSRRRAGCPEAIFRTSRWRRWRRGWRGCTSWPAWRW